MTWNLLHLGKMLAPGISNQGNDRKAWEAGARFGIENPKMPPR